MSMEAFYRGEEHQAQSLLGSFGSGRDWSFRLWAPRAQRVELVGDFNGWQLGKDVMSCNGEGIWEYSIGIGWEGMCYKYAITGCDGVTRLKADPFAKRAEAGDKGTASLLYENRPYPWGDEGYLKALSDSHDRPVNIYELHLGSWKRGMGYRELGYQLVDYAVDMGYTHIELLPLTEYPYDPSWGYQVTGFFAPTGRFGSPEDLKFLIDRAHERGLGVIMDWVPAHFTRDEFGLSHFDGAPLYEHPDPRRGDMQQWGTLLFDYGRPEVKSFLISSALYWLQEYHLDGLRVDAVSCMLYLDFGKEGQDVLKNSYGGNVDENAVALLQALSAAVHALPYNKLLIAEESSAYPLVTNKQGEGLGFDYKWNMGWMHDTLSYMQTDPLYRCFAHSKLTFSLTYAFSEHYMLAYSHDEVVHGKKSMLDKMPGGYEDKFAQLRLLYCYMMAHPGKKLSFMGMELGQFMEWRFDHSLDWMLLGYPRHRDLQAFVRSLNHFYKEHPALYEIDGSWDGFYWGAVDDAQSSTVSFIRSGKEEKLLCVFNFTPVHRPHYTMPLPIAGSFIPVFGSSPLPQQQACYTTAEEETGYSLTLPAPPFSAVFYRCMPSL